MTPVASQTAAPPTVLTEQGVKEFVVAWYRALDEHAPIEQCLSFQAF